MKVIAALLAVTLVCSLLPVAAQPGINEMQQASANLTRSFFTVRDCSLILAALFGIIGALKVYYNWQMGERRVTSEIAAWFFASLFMVLMGPFVQSIFGIR